MPPHPLFLLLLPPEITDLIFSLLPTYTSSQTRLLSKSHNQRFQSRFRSIIFTRLKLNLHPATLLQLSRITESGAGPWIQHVTFSSKPFSNLYPKFTSWLISISSQLPPGEFPLEYEDEGNQEANTNIDSTTTSNINNNTTLTRILKNLPNLRSIDFDGSCTITHWQILTTSISNSNISTVETLRSPPVKMLVSELNLGLSTPETIISQYSQGFHKLKTLEMRTEGASGMLESLWLWISTVGRNSLEDLTIRHLREDNTEPSPNTHGGFLPENFSLPNLKRIHLDGFNLTFKDITLLLSPSSASKLEKIHLSKCRMNNNNNPAKNWFTVLTYLKRNTFPNLTSLRLTLSGYYNGLTTYDLPDLKIANEISGKPWNSTGAKCEVRLKSGEWYAYVVKKNLWDELGGYDNNDNDDNDDDINKFWESLTNGKWKSKRATRWKRLIRLREIERSEFGYRSRELREKIMTVSREVDSDCEDVRY
ncbi:hypothetical protein TWF718_010278 [Orbilia javanica]|uniref:F-box domain-containing protein n=1 Tax=Orbilia javanica TaxID=47235 RepID=A0AAN8MXJ1_9PEZI